MTKNKQLNKQVKLGPIKPPAGSWSGLKLARLGNISLDAGPRMPTPAIILIKIGT